MKRQKSWRLSPKRELPAMTTANDTIDEAQFKLREIASPMWADTRQASLARVARTIGISRSLAERIVYRKLKRLDAHVLENIRSAYAQLEDRAERMADEQQQIQRALRREIEGRLDATVAENQGGELARTGKSSGG